MCGIAGFATRQWPSPFRTRRSVASLSIALAALTTSLANAATVVDWFTYTGSGAAATGTRGSDIISIATSDGVITGPADTSFALDAAFPYVPDNPVPGIGLRNPVGLPNASTYVLDFDSVTNPAELTLGISEIDGTFGSVTLSASSITHAPISLASLTVIGQYFEDGLPSGSTNSVTVNGDGTLTLASTRDTRSDTKAIYFEGFPSNLGSLTLRHDHPRPNPGPSEWDTIRVTIGRVPEPSSAALLLCGITLLMRRIPSQQRGREAFPE
jgi:hypothetical protein